MNWRDVWIVAFTLVTFWTIYAARQETHRTRAALCTLRGDLAQRVQQADVFLKKHPNGAFGFTRAEILTGRNNQQRTVDALAGLNCPSTKEH